METATPVDVITEQTRAARRAQAFAVIEKPPGSIAAQKIVLIFIYAMLGLAAFISFDRPSVGYSPFIILALVPAVTFVAANGMNTQRRLEAVIDIVKQDAKKT